MGKFVFVFGSNLAGRHGKGAAKFAVKNFGAIYGQGKGPQGNSYAIPTKDEDLNSLPLNKIKEHIADFIDYAKHSDDTFLLTPVGCGLAGHKKADIWAILKALSLPGNVALSSTWVTD